MAENVRVVVRCRPMNSREHQLKCRNITHIEDCTISVRNPSDQSAPAKTFTYDSVYDALAPTEALYNDICYSLVDNVLEGYNGTIFAYGQTGCGKTHTMQGPDNVDGNPMAVPSAQRGIISRSFDHIFEAISVASGVRYLALVSYLEIYNECIRDLLNPNESINANHPLKELPGVGVIVPTISTHTVHDANECHQLLTMGNRNRMVGATLMNASSSRSHSIFTICLEQIQNDADGSGGLIDVGDDVEVGASGIRRGKLNLVDLAGSERQNKTGAVGERLKEATKINLSLSALGNVISALVDGKTKHIPYRDSKLTRLLQDSLGGNTKTLMISCISPADNNYDETISTLRYASRAKNISNKPRINEDPKDAKLREYQDEILKLKRMLNENTPQQHLLSRGADDEAANRQWLEEERGKLQLEMEQEMQRLRAEHVEEQREKEQQMREMTELRQHYEQQLQQLGTINARIINTVRPPTIMENPEQAIDPNAEGEEQVGKQRKQSDRSQGMSSTLTMQLEARNRIDLIKRALIGGERANDTQLKERRQKKKMDAQRRLSALAHVLSRVEQSEDRDLLQGHYTNIQQELNAKNEYLKAYRQKVKALEREVSDLQAEFQLDRADYLETIRRLERNLKFYQQIMEKALPILRKDGKYWDPNEILQSSIWNDDLKIWKLPESSMNSFRLPPAMTGTGTNSKSYFESTTIKAIKSAAKKHNSTSSANSDDNNNEPSKWDSSNAKGNSSSNNDSDSEAPLRVPQAGDEDSHKNDILRNYFRSNRTKTTEVLQQRKDIAQRSRRMHYVQRQGSQLSSAALASKDDIASAPPIDNYFRKMNGNVETRMPPELVAENRVLSSWLPQHYPGSRNIPLNKTWGGGVVNGNDRLLATSIQNDFKMRPLQKDNDEEDAGIDYRLNTHYRNRQRHSPSTATHNFRNSDSEQRQMPTENKKLLFSQARRPHKVAALQLPPTRNFDDDTS